MFKFIKSMSWFIKKNWYRYIFVLFFGLILTVLNLFPAKIIAVLTRGIEHNTLTKDVLIYQVLLPFIGTIIAIYVIAICKRISQNRLTTTVYYALHQRYMERILKQDATFFEKYQAGDLLTRALGDINTVKFSGGNRLLNIFLESVSVVVTFTAMCFIDPLLALACFFPLSFIFIANLKLRAKVKRNWKIVREKNSLMGNVILESITNVRTIRAFSKEEENYQKNLVYSNQAYEVEKSNLKVNVIFQPMFQSIVAISMIICYSLGAYFYSLGRITEIALLIQFTMYLNMFQQPLTNIGNMLNNFYQSLISADRLNEVYDSKSRVIVHNKPLELTKIDRLEFKHYTFNYLDDTFNSIDDVSIVVNNGQTLGIVGRTGSGKSTLVKQLVRQYPANEGMLLINGYPVEDYKKEDVRKKIAYVPQEHVLFSRSVIDNVALGKENPTKEEIMKAIKLADFSKDIANLPEGLDTIVGEYGVTLSGGQKQRLAIARAFLRDSDVLILDDSLSAVDGTTEANIIKALKEYRSNKTNIIVAHRLSAVMHADEIIVLDGGHVVERGTHQQLMNNKRWYYEQFNLQQMSNDGGDINE